MRTTGGCAEPEGVMFRALLFDYFLLHILMPASQNVVPALTNPSSKQLAFFFRQTNDCSGYLVVFTGL